MSSLYAVFPSASAPDSGTNKVKNAAIVREGFNWFAFLLAPLWAIFARNILAIVLWVGLTILVEVIADQAQFNSFGGHFLVALWFGFAAADLQKHKYAGKENALPTYVAALNPFHAQLQALELSADESSEIEAAPIDQELDSVQTDEDQSNMSAQDQDKPEQRDA